MHLFLRQYFCEIRNNMAMVRKSFSLQFHGDILLNNGDRNMKLGMKVHYKQ